MGCCISKCRPDNNHSLEEHHHHQLFNHVQDKLIISQAPPPPLPTTPPTIINPRPSKYKISPSPPSPTSSTSSISSFTCTTSNTISSASSLSSASSATLTSKDRSFSNQFLWSCYKDNPHIIRINSLRDATLSLTNTKPKPEYQPKNNTNPSPPKPGLAPPILKQHSPPHKVVGSFSTMPQKRVRSNSPTNLTRQKSFRKEQPERPVRMLGSPSPSRRFSNGGDKYGSALGTTTMDTSVSKRMSSSPKVSAVQSRSVSSSLRNKERVKAASPNNSSLGRLQYSGLRHRATRTLRVGSKIDETVVKDVLSNHDMDLDLTEDIDYPLISLDCFIFL